LRLLIAFHIAIWWPPTHRSSALKHRCTV